MRMCGAGRGVGRGGRRGRLEVLRGGLRGPFNGIACSRKRAPGW